MVLTLRFELEAFGRPFNAARNWYGPDAYDSLWHTHEDFHELMCVLAGSGEHHLRTGTVPLVQGDVVLIRAADEHAIFGREPDGLDFVNVAFPVAPWQGYVELSGLDPDRQWDRARLPPTFRAATDRGPELRTVFETALARSADEPRRLDLLRFWTDLFFLIIPSGEAAETGTPAWLRSAQAAMRHEDNLRVGLPRMLELANVSAGHLARTMRRHDGITPIQFVTDLRLQHAATLLRTTTYSIAEVAERSGFASQSYFTRRFAATHYLTPGEFRRLSRTT